MLKNLSCFHIIMIVSLGIFLLFSCSNDKNSRSYDIVLKQDRKTILMADAGLPSNRIEAEIPTHGAKRFGVSDWRRSRDALTWFVDSYKNGNFNVTLLIKGMKATIEISSGSETKTETLHLEKWDRVEIGQIKLEEGINTITFRSLEPGQGFELFSVELIEPEVKEKQQQQAKELRSSTKWMQKAKYGIQFHWTSMSQPRSGPHKPYEQAVQDFDVDAFAGMVHKTGASWVIITTSHGEYYFPAPIKSIDRIMAGRTTSRDLVDEWYKALNKYGIRLMLYYHVGHDHYMEMDGWWRRVGFDPHQPKVFIDNWCDIITEVGERYEKKLSGWFFDDGIVVYYPLNPSFERLARAAKAGNPDRIICYNPWILPRATDFQDYLCGEGYQFLLMKEHLPKDGSGVFTGGPHKGLLAHTNFPLEGEWGHFRPETPIPSPRVSKEQFVKDMIEAIKRGIRPSVNLSIYQDGRISEESMTYMLAVKEALEKKD